MNYFYRPVHTSLLAPELILMHFHQSWHFLFRLQVILLLLVPWLEITAAHLLKLMTWWSQSGFCNLKAIRYGRRLRKVALSLYLARLSLVSYCSLTADAVSRWAGVTQLCLQCSICRAGVQRARFFCWGGRKRMSRVTDSFVLACATRLKVSWFFTFHPLNKPQY